MNKKTFSYKQVGKLFILHWKKAHNFEFRDKKKIKNEEEAYAWSGKIILYRVEEIY